MIELSGMFVGGFLGSAHCVGMCGGIAAWCCAGGTNGAAGTLRRSVAFSLGRSFTYLFLGALAWRAGTMVERLPLGVLGAQRLLAVVAGLALIVVAWNTAVRRGGAASAASSLALLPTGVVPGAFVGGLLTGFIPCGLVYASLALVAAQPTLAKALLSMACFAFGTWPLMVVSGWWGVRVGPLVRTRLHGLAAAFLAVVGVVTLARGLVTP